MLEFIVAAILCLIPLVVCELDRIGIIDIESWFKND